MKTITTDDGRYLLDYGDELTPYKAVLNQVARAIASDREGKVKRALIELGWTPPADKQPH